MTRSLPTFAAVAALLLLDTHPWAAASPSSVKAEARLAALERAAGGRLGVAALDTAEDAQIRYRADERFPLCSTFKVLMVFAILEQSATDGQLLERPVTYSKDALVTYSPITAPHAVRGMTVAQSTLRNPTKAPSPVTT